MRKRIEELAEGKIPYEQPQLVFSKEKLELEVVEGQKVTESFQIRSQNGLVMRGIVYSSSARMECLTPQFEGEEVLIRVEFTAKGMSEGEIETGSLYVVCNGGEYQLSFAVMAIRLYAEASTGKIKNLNDFAALALENWKESFHVFHSPAFRNLLTPRDLKASLLYQGLGQQAVTEHTMDEFLIGIRRKERVRFKLEKQSAEYFEVKRPVEEQIHIHKEGWGFLEIRISSSDEFLVPQKKYLTTEDFIGNMYPFRFYIDTEKMHAGNNYATITFSNDVQTEYFTIWVSADSLEVRKERTYREFQAIRTELIQNYIDYRLKKIVTGEWTKNTLALAERYEQIHPRNEWSILLKAYAYLMNKQNQDAEWLLSDFKQMCKDHKKLEWAVYDYICLQNEKEPSVIDRLNAEIEEIMRRYPSNALVFLMNLRLNGTWGNQSQARLRMIEDRVMQGQYTPLWYVEAFAIYLEEPYYLTKLDKFEIMVMNWASRKGIMTQDLAEQMIRLANNMRYFHPIVSRTLSRCFEQFPSEDFLAGVCAYLIKGQCYEIKYHSWFARGVEENLKITGLYEAYLLTMDLHKIVSIPKVIQMYFQYNNQLPYQYKAALYVNIIAHKLEEPGIYEKYVETMKQFAIDEILKGNIDDNLSVIYEEMLDSGILTKELAGYLADILYTHKFYCSNSAAAYVVVVQKHMRGEQRVPIQNGYAYFQLFSNDYAIMLEDNRGQRYVEPESCELEKLMKPSHYIRRCLALAPDKLQYVMHHMDGKTDLTIPQKSDVEYLMAMMEAPEISTQFKTQMGPGLVRYCLLNNVQDHLADYLAQIDFAEYSRQNRNSLIELMIDNGWFEKAYELVNAYGYVRLDKEKLSLLAAHVIRTKDIGEDVFLLDLCMVILQAGIRNKQVVTYLAKYYEGPSKFMMLVYLTACELAIEELGDLEERLLVQTLYSTEYVGDIQKVYEGYCSHKGREFIRQAYRSYYLHEYVVNDMVLAKNLFLEAARLHRVGKLRGMACKLGLLKYFSECRQLSNQEFLQADDLLNEFTSRNMCFSFFKNLPSELCSRYQLYHRALVEYHARPDSRIQIHYRLPKEQEEFTTAVMPNIYDGIFTWEFFLFFDDEIEYYITEEEEDGIQQLGESKRLQGITYRDVKHGGRYAYVNRMLYLCEQAETEELLQLMREYKKLDIVTEKVFRII